MSTTTMYAVKKVDKDKSPHKITSITLKNSKVGSPGSDGSSAWRRDSPLKVGAVPLSQRGIGGKRSKRKRGRKNRSKKPGALDGAGASTTSGDGMGVNCEMDDDSIGSGGGGGSGSGGDMAGFSHSNGLGHNSHEEEEEDNLQSTQSSPEAGHSGHTKSKSGSTGLSSGNTKSKKYDPSSNPYSLENYKRDPELQITLESTADHAEVPIPAANTHFQPGASMESLDAVPLTPLFPSPKLNAQSVLPMSLGPPQWDRISSLPNMPALNSGTPTSVMPPPMTIQPAISMPAQMRSPMQQMAPQMVQVGVGQMPPQMQQMQQVPPPQIPGQALNGMAAPNGMYMMPTAIPSQPGINMSYQRLNQAQAMPGAQQPPRHAVRRTVSNMGPQLPPRRGGRGGGRGMTVAEKRGHRYSNRSMHHIPLRSLSLQDHLALQDSSECPHGNLTPEQLINIKIRKRNVCYVVGLPIHVATEQKLRAQEWFGQFGNVATIAINRNQKSTLANSIPAHITYDNNISALNAINFCNKFIFDDGRKLKATFGTQHYCRWFISANKKCTNVYCGFRHSWCRADDIITQKDIADFKAIPAGAYTSRNVENQPIGRHSMDTFNHRSHVLREEYNGRISDLPRGPRGQYQPNRRQQGAQSQTTPNLFQNNRDNRGLDSPNQVTVSYSADTVTNGASRSGSNSRGNNSMSNNNNSTSNTGGNRSPAAQGNYGGFVPKANGSGGGTNHQNNSTKTAAKEGGNNSSNNNNKGNKETALSIGADPYTFYLSNSSLTPTNISPQIPPSPDTVMKTLNAQSNSKHNSDNTQNALNFVKKLDEAVAKQKSQAQQIAQLKEQLVKMEKQRKEEVERERAEKEGVRKEMEALQLRYLQLEASYKKVLKADGKGWKEWTPSEVLSWMLEVSGGKFVKYEEALRANIETENIDGACLCSLDKGDVHRLGITDFKDKTELLAHIEALASPKPPSSLD